MYLLEDGYKTLVVGPYWRSVIRVYNIQVGDVVSFTYVGGDEDFSVSTDDIFALTVYQVGVNGKEVKLPVAEPGKITKS